MHPESAKRAVDRVKSAVELRQSPVRKAQDSVPIADAMRDFWERGMLTFSIPAHNGGRGPAPEFTKWAGMDSARCDLPMSHGLDTRDRAWKVQSTAQELFAEAVGAKRYALGGKQSEAAEVKLLKIARRVSDGSVWVWSL